MGIAYLEMTNRQIMITEKDKYKLEVKAKQGWKCYYIELDRINNMSSYYQQTSSLANQVRNGDDIDISFLRQSFLELYGKVGELVNCPVCFEPMDKNNTFVPLCGHLVCRTCKFHPSCDKCPICRRAYTQ